MSRKPHNRRARLERACRSLLRANHVAVVNIDPSGWQGMVNWKSAKRIAAGRALADAICDVPHRWTIFLAGLCIDQNGQRYMKSQEVAPDGIYLAEHLTEVIEACYRELCSTSSPLAGLPFRTPYPLPKRRPTGSSILWAPGSKQCPPPQQSLPDALPGRRSGGSIPHHHYRHARGDQ